MQFISASRSHLETVTATASGALVVIHEPLPDAARVPAMAATGADHGGAGAGQATQRAPDAGHVTERAPGPGHALTTHGAAAGQLGHVQPGVGRSGQAFEQLRPRPEHFPPVEKVRIRQDVRVVEIVILWPDHFGV